MPDYDATVTEKFKEAGAIIIGARSGEPPALSVGIPIDIPAEQAEATTTEPAASPTG